MPLTQCVELGDVVTVAASDQILVRKCADYRASESRIEVDLAVSISIRLIEAEGIEHVQRIFSAGVGNDRDARGQLVGKYGHAAHFV